MVQANIRVDVLSRASLATASVSHVRTASRTAPFAPATRPRTVAAGAVRLLDQRPHAQPSRPRSYAEAPCGAYLRDAPVGPKLTTRPCARVRRRCVPIPPYSTYSTVKSPLLRGTWGV